MLSRRDMVGKLAAGAAAVCVAGAAKNSLASTRPARSTPEGSAGGPAAVPAPRDEKLNVPVVDSGPPTTLSAQVPWELLRPLTLGATVADGWHVAGFTGADGGSCVLTLANERGRSHRVHLCRNDGRPQGLVFTRQFDLVVMNGGQGDLPTDESFARAVAAVAHVLAANEADRRHEPVVTALLSARRARPALRRRGPAALSPRPRRAGASGAARIESGRPVSMTLPTVMEGYVR